MSLPRRRFRRSEPWPLATSQPNEVWAYDFLFDRCTNGEAIKCLTIVDEGSRECLAIDVAGGIRARRVVEILKQLVAERGAPRHLRSDNGPDFLAYAAQDSRREAKIETAYIQPGKRWQNGLNESFNGRLRDECLNGGSGLSSEFAPATPRQATFRWFIGSGEGTETYLDQAPRRTWPGRAPVWAPSSTRISPFTTTAR